MAVRRLAMADLGKNDLNPNYKETFMINRAAVILKYKDPFVRWINEADPDKSGTPVTLEDANSDRTVYLITDEDGENIDEWISLNYKALLENELEDWYNDESLWPQNRTKKLFQSWVEVACHTVIFDTVGTPIVDDEI
jgi:hypothetical protein